MFLCNGFRQGGEGVAIAVLSWAPVVQVWKYSHWKAEL